MKKKILSTASFYISIFLILCFCWNKIEEPVPEVGVLDGVQVGKALFTDSELLETQILNAPRGIVPYEVVLHENQIYYLGKEKDDTIGLYHVEIGEIDDVTVLWKSQKSAVWKNLQWLDGMLIWDKYSDRQDTVSDERLTYSLQETIGEAPFRYGNLLEWEGNYFTFEGHNLDSSLLMIKSESKLKNPITIEDNIFLPYDGTYIFDGSIACQSGSEDWVVRLNLENGEATDKLLLQNIRFEGVLCSWEHLIGWDFDGNVWGYSYESGQTFLLKTIEDYSEKTMIRMRDKRVWIIQKEHIEVYDLENMTRQILILEKSNYTDYFLDAEGRLLVCDKLHGKFVLIS